MLTERLSSLSETQPGTYRKLLAGVFWLSSLAVIAMMIHRAFTGYLMDLEVFQDAGWALRRGQDLYSEDFPTRSGFRFIYPPFAAVLFYALTWFGPITLQVVWTAATMAAVLAMLWMVLVRLRVPYPKTIAFALLGMVMVLDPLWANIKFGQINVFLALLVVSDVLGFLPKKLRGLGVGVAAGIKITPAAYALVFLMRKDFRAVATSFLWFLVTVLIGFIARFEESVYFWTEEFFNSNRGGDAQYMANQAFSGLLARAGVSESTQEIATMAFFVFGAIAAAYVSWVFLRQGHEVAALGYVALAVSFAGPYAVSHHWSIVMVFFPLLLVLPKLWQLVMGLAFAIAHWWAPYEVFGEEAPTIAANVGEWFYGNMQGVMGMVVFITVLIAAARMHKKL